MSKSVKKWRCAWHLKKPARNRWFFEYIYYRGKTPGPPPSLRSEASDLGLPVGPVGGTTVHLSRGETCPFCPFVDHFVHSRGKTRHFCPEIVVFPRPKGGNARFCLYIGQLAAGNGLGDGGNSDNFAEKAVSLSCHDSRRLHRRQHHLGIHAAEPLEAELSRPVAGNARCWV